MNESSERLEAHHVFWVKKLWEFKPYKPVRDHPKAIIMLSHEIHHGELHPKFYYNPMPLPPIWAVSYILDVLNDESIYGPMEAIRKIILVLHQLKRYPRRLRGNIIAKEDRLRLENLRLALADQLHFLESKNVTC